MDFAKQVGPRLYASISDYARSCLLGEWPFAREAFDARDDGTAQDCVAEHRDEP